MRDVNITHILLARGLQQSYSLDMTKTIPNGDHSPADILRLARVLGVSGVLVSRGRRTQTRAYPVLLGNGEILMWRINAAPEFHTT